MNLNVNVEKNGFRLSAILVTNDLKTHSQLQHVPEKEREEIKSKIAEHLEDLCKIIAKYQQPR